MQAVREVASIPGYLKKKMVPRHASESAADRPFGISEGGLLNAIAAALLKHRSIVADKGKPYLRNIFFSGWFVASWQVCSFPHLVLVWNRKDE
jgi:hypothetical protein